jgi:hypothetical protein
MRHVKRAFAAENAETVLLVEADPRGELGKDAAGELGGGDGVKIGADFGMELSEAGDPGGIREGQALRGAGDEPRDGGGVTADVEDATATELVFEEPAPGIVPGMETEGGVNHADLADDAGADELDQPRGLRVAAVHEGFHEEDAVLARGLGHDHGFGVVQRERLFAKDVLAGPRRLDAPLGMRGVRRADVDGVDLGVGEERLIAAIRALESEFLRKFIRGFPSAAADGDQRSRAGFGQPFGESVGDTARSDDAPTDARCLIAHDARLSRANRAGNSRSHPARL